MGVGGVLETPPHGILAPSPNNTLITTVYRKPTHTDQYLHWDSNHFIAAKHSVYNTLVPINQEGLHKELNHVRRALQACHIPPMGT